MQKGEKLAELLKNVYNYQSLHNLALRIKTVHNSFETEDFVEKIMDETWDELSIKARMRKIAINLGKYLPTDYKKALTVIDKVIANDPKEFHDFSRMYFPDFVEVYGQDKSNWDLSMNALERYTKSSTAEFAVRAFIINDEKLMMQQMKVWSKSGNEHVRRLASEGCRPQLPWAKALNNFKKDPTQILDILEQLKSDSSLYVRKSVANNLNDISKTHPNLVIEIAKKWYGKNQKTDWILKHGCRTLLKKGQQEVLNIFGFTASEDLKFSELTLSGQTILIGESLTFSFKLETKKPHKVRVEYCIDYVKANGQLNPKIFQISEGFLKANELKVYSKKHSFANLSTRKHYFGVHEISVIINGVKRGFLNFEIINFSTSKKI